MDDLISQLQTLVTKISELRSSEREMELDKSNMALQPEFSKLESNGWTFQEYRPDQILRCVGKHYRIYYNGKLVKQVQCCSSLQKLFTIMTELQSKKPRTTYINNAANRKLNRVGHSYK